jgi:hypothetical protein
MLRDLAGQRVVVMVASLIDGALVVEDATVFSALPTARVRDVRH